MKTPHLLIIRFSAMGDVAMTVPVVDALARQYPDLRITVLSRSFARPFFANMPQNVSFMEADLKGEYRGVRGLNALYRRLVVKNFTAMADFHSVLRSNYLRMRFKIDRYHAAHIDKHRYGRRKLVARKGKKLVQQPTSFEKYAAVLEKLGYPVKLDFKSIFPAEGGDLSLLPEAFRLPRKEGESRIGIAPFAAHEGKIYPLPLMEEVIAKLAEKHPQCRMYLFGGGKKEMGIIDGWCAKYGNCVNASQQLGSLDKELVLMSHLDVMLSMDSGNMHLASLAGTPVVSVWGATHPYAGFLGWGQSPDNVMQADMPCRPCSIYGNKPCMHGDYRCLTAIKPADVVERIERVMKKK